MAATLITRKDHHHPMEVPNLHNPVLNSQKRSRTSYMEQQQQGGDYYHRNQLGLRAKNPRVDRFNNNGVVNYGPKIQSLPQLEGKKVELNYGVSGFHARVQAWKPELSNNGGLAPKFQALPQLQDQEAGGNNGFFMPNLQAWKPQSNNFVVSRPYPPISWQFQGMKPGFYNGFSVPNYQVSQHFQDSSLKVDNGVFNPNHPAMQQFQEKKSEVNRSLFMPNLNLYSSNSLGGPLTQVEAPCFYNPLTTALQPRNKTWQGMKTMAELRRENNLPIPVNKDSLYKPIERTLKKFNPLVIPKSLQATLPFESKPKDIPKGRPTLERRRAVVMEPDERKVHALVQQLRLITNDKMKKRKVKIEQERKKLEAEKAKDEELSRKRKREERRERYRVQEKMKKKSRRNSDA